MKSINKDIIFRKNYMEHIDINNKFFNLNNKNYYLYSEFAYYLTGLIEGDGSILTPSFKDKDKKSLYPVIKITFAEKDLQLAKKLNSYLELGKIYKEKGNYINLVFYKLDVIFLIIYLINGKMRTPKINGLYKLIDWFNLRSNINIEKLSTDLSNIENNSWLSGFLDSDGSFSSFFKINKVNIATNISCYMRLSQNRYYYKNNNELSDLKSKENNKIDNNDTYLPIMENIKNFLYVKNLRLIKRNKNKNVLELGYEVRTIRIESNKILMHYLDKHPLFSSKYLDYLDWRNIFEIKINKKYKSIEGTNLLVTLKSNMNNSRSKFDWKHLNNFWTI